MTKLATVLCLAATGAFATNALAQTRPMTPKMACADIQRLVVQRGAVVLGFGPDLYDRVVSTPRYCLPGAALIRIDVPARDTPACFAGYTCREADGPDNW